jgi:glycosylphosphatidylinositol transamidase
LSLLIRSYVDQFEQILQRLQLKTGQQYYELPEDEFGIGVNGTNVYGILRAPRGDATEAIVLSTSWKTLDGSIDIGGVALLMSLARYFKRTSSILKLY